MPGSGWTSRHDERRTAAARLPRGTIETAMRVIGWLLVVLLVLLLLAVALVAMFPARLAWDWFGPRAATVQLDEVGGTIWRGRARQLWLHDQPIGAITWRIAPQALLRRRLDADLTLDGEEYRGAGFVSVGRDMILLDGARLSMAAQRMQPVLDIPALNLHGRVDLELRRAELVAGFPRRLDGVATWRDAAVDGAAAATFGDISAEFRTAEDGALVGTVADHGGPLAVDGQFRAAFTGFEAEALLVARDGNPQVLEALRYIGEQQPDGSSILQIRGSLLPWQ
jgi:general secretion pathway protein N